MKHLKDILCLVLVLLLLVSGPVCAFASADSAPAATDIASLQDFLSFAEISLQRLYWSIPAISQITVVSFNG